MGKTLILSAESNMDFATRLHVGNDGIFRADRPAAPASHLTASDNTDRKNATGAFQFSDDTTGELLSDLLASPTMAQQVVYGTRKRSAAGFADASPPKPPKSKPCVSEMGEQSTSQFDSDAISLANMRAFKANRLQAQAYEVASSRRKPSTSVQPKTTSRQRKGTVRHRRPSPGAICAEPHQPSYRPAWEILDRSILPQVKICEPPTIAQPTELQHIKSPLLQVSPNRGLPEDRRKFNRKSESILALTEAVRLEPKNVMEPRRSKTTREPRKAATLLRQKSVFKKMTSALTDRLHLTQKPVEVEAHEADEGRGGFYEYESHRFIRDVEANLPTQKRQLPSRLTEIYERESYYQSAKNVNDNCFDTISEMQGVESPARKESFDDPFGDPEPSRETTDFVARLKATTPSKSDLDATRVTPSASMSKMEGLLRGSINSLLPFPPLCASTPRLKGDRRRYSSLENSHLKQVSSVPLLSTSVGLGKSDIAADESSDAESDEDMPTMRKNLRPGQGYTYRPVLNAPNRKKHPSPNKIDLELLETQLRDRWPETLSQATEKAKKHPSPLKVDMQTLGEQFRQAYPDLLAGNTPEQSSQGDTKTAKKTRVVKDDDGTDELALSFATSTPEKGRLSRHRKALSTSFSSQETMPSKKDKRKTVAMSKYLGGLDSTDELACAAYREA